MKIYQPEIYYKHIIYKYSLPEGGQKIITAPFDELLDAQEQNGQLVIWASIIPDCEEIPVCFTILGTGWPYDSKKVGKYFKTIQDQEGLVWHIFVKEYKPNDNFEY